MNNAQTKQQKAMMRVMLFVTGVIALIFATMCLAMPLSVEEMVGLDPEIVNILGIALTIIGLGDLLVSLVIFKRRDRK